MKRSRVGLKHLRNPNPSGRFREINAENTHIFELSPEDWKLIFRFSGWKLVHEEVFYMTPSRHPLSPFRYALRRYDFEGFYGVILRKSLQESELYRDWWVSIEIEQHRYRFLSQWQRWQQKLPKDKRFAERSIRNLVGFQDELEIASERLGHASTAKTNKFYRSNVTNVIPITWKQTQKNSWEPGKTSGKIRNRLRRVFVIAF